MDSTCVSPCSDFLVLSAVAGCAFLVLLGVWYGRPDPKCRCPVPEKCSHKEKGGTK